MVNLAFFKTLHLMSAGEIVSRFSIYEIMSLQVLIREIDKTTRTKNMDYNTRAIILEIMDDASDRLEEANKICMN